MSVKDSSSIISTSSFLKRLTGKRSSGPGSPLRSPSQAEAPPWIPPLVDLGQLPETQPLPTSSPPSTPRIKPASQSSRGTKKIESSPPVLNLPTFIAAPVTAKPTTYHQSHDGPQLPPVASIDTSFDLDMLNGGFLRVPDEHGLANVPPSASPAKAPSIEAVVEAPPNAASETATPASDPVRDQRRSRTLASIFRRKAKVSPTVMVSGSPEKKGEGNGSTIAVRRHSHTPPTETAKDDLSCNASRKSVPASSPPKPVDPVDAKLPAIATHDDHPAAPKQFSEA